MSSPHWASLQDWESVKKAAELVGSADCSVILELAGRLASAEGRISELQANQPAPPDSSPPAGGLVERVADQLHVEAGFRDTSPDGSWDVEARAAILACAMWLEERGLPTAAHLLREEVGQ